MAKGKAASNKGPSRMEIVRAALQELGENAKPLEIQAHIKEKTGQEIPTNIISNYKFQIRSKASGTSRGRRRTAAGALQVEDFEAIRGLVNRLGADQVKRLVDVVA